MQKNSRIFQFYLFRFIGIALLLLNKVQNSVQHEITILQHKKFEQKQFYITLTYLETYHNCQNITDVLLR